MSIGGHQSANMKTDEWLTPPEIIKDLGPFDLDPCSPINRPWDTAKNHFSINENGLMQPWSGRIWLNPPYGKELKLWLQKMALHGNGIALIFARTETKAFFDWVWPYASAMHFIEGRLYFYLPDGTKAKANAGAPSVLIAYGPDNMVSLCNSDIKGVTVLL